MIGALLEQLRRSPPPGISAADVEDFFARRRPELLMHLSPLLPNHDRIVTLNLGLGRDSMAMLCLLGDGRLKADGRLLNPSEVDAVIFSDTGAEWAHSYRLLPRVRALCERLGLRLVVLRKPPSRLSRPFLDSLPPPGSPGRRAALQSRPWRTDAPATLEERAESGWYHLRPDILDDYRSRATIASRQKKDCTDNHKIEPIRKVINDLAVEKFSLDNTAWGNLVRKGERRPHLTLIGIAHDEQERALEGHPLRGGSGPWYVTEAYPLIELGIGKPDEAEILEGCGFADVRKSGCRMCPFQPLSWYWVLRETDPAAWEEVVAYEETALAANPRMFVTGDAPLPTMVRRWRARNPDATVEGVLEKSYRRCGVEG